MGKIIVQVIHDTTNKVVKEIPCASRRQAEKVMDGILANMNEAEYSVEIKEK